MIPSKLSASISDRLRNTDKVVIGAGTGLSVSGGLDYNDPDFFKRWYKPFLCSGVSSVSEAIAAHWHLTDETSVAYWGFWAHHINNIYYLHEQLEVYKHLYKLVRDKDYFIITTNTDGQFFKGSFNPRRVFAPQGGYCGFQCMNGCHDEVYDSAQPVKQMLAGFDSTSFRIKKDDVPRCPVCGGLLCPNLRRTNNFINTACMRNRNDYLDFLNVSDERILFLEIGVGGYSPDIISRPFEDMAVQCKNASHVKIDNESGKEIHDIIMSIAA